MNLESRFEPLIDVVRRIGVAGRNRASDLEARLGPLIEFLLGRVHFMRTVGLPWVAFFAVGGAVWLVIAMPHNTESMLAFALIGVIVYDIGLTIALERREATRRTEEDSWWRYGAIGSLGETPDSDYGEEIEQELRLREIQDHSL